MAGQRRVNRNRGCLEVTNFTQHHHVGCLPQHCPERVGKSQVHRGMDLHLVDSLEQVLNRILDGDDLAIRLVDVVQAGVQGGGFT